MASSLTALADHNVSERHICGSQLWVKQAQEHRCSGRNSLCAAFHAETNSEVDTAAGCRSQATWKCNTKVLGAECAKHTCKGCSTLQCSHTGVASCVPCVPL